MKFLVESELRSGYKIHKLDVRDGALPTQKRVHYHFKHRHGSGDVVIHYGKGMESKIDFRVNRNDRHPDPHNARAILKTVEKAVRHHLAKEKPKVVGYHALSDDHDRGSHNRRGAIYQRIAKKLSARSKKPWVGSAVTTGLPGRMKFKKKAR